MVTGSVLLVEETLAASALDVDCKGEEEKSADEGDDEAQPCKNEADEEDEAEEEEEKGQEQEEEEE